MKLEDAFKVARKEYEKAVHRPEIKKPIAYALYHAWRWVDSQSNKQDKNSK